ncbi:hypothetical protein LY76DRAFT_237869 [Colletotrichum caudatum]|nr:hypothetical protein LY76DRAFT_237869 [Colletotrichum caudatum]
MSTCSRSGEPFHSGIPLPSGPDASLALFRLYHPHSFSCNRRFTRTCSRVPTSYGATRLGHRISQNPTRPGGGGGGGIKKTNHLGSRNSHHTLPRPPSTTRSGCVDVLVLLRRPMPGHDGLSSSANTHLIHQNFSQQQSYRTEWSAGGARA